MDPNAKEISTETPNNPSILLNEEQLSALSQITQWLQTNKTLEFRLGGYAGTGKTTLLKVVVESHKQTRQREESESQIAISALTGKAVSILHKKGMWEAQTIHSLIYNVRLDEKTKLPIFVKKSCLDDEIDLIIVDEASMISKELYQDLLSFKTHILWVGDPGQLEPVGEDIYLMAKPDFTLENIHRQAKGSEIILFADRIRKGYPFLNHPSSICPLDFEVWCTNKDIGLRKENLLWADSIIVGFNTIRQQINNQLRQILEFSQSLLPQPKEKIIVLRNNTQFGVYNGQVFIIQSINNKGNCVVHDDLYREFKFPLWLQPFTSPKAKIDLTHIPKDKVYCDFGYCLTCHKAQGSEWEKVLVFEPGFWGKPNEPWCEKRRWQYTAATRAKKQLIYCR